MDNNNEINQKIAQNLIRYRKVAGFTQAEVAEKINYSDKSVSKWESGNGIPDVYTLIQLSKLYGVSVNALIEEEEIVPVVAKKNTKGLHLLIMLLSSGIVWLVATFLFVTLHIISPNGAWWLTFLYAVLVNAIVMLVYAWIWKYRVINFISVTAIIWVSLLCCFLTVQQCAIRFNFSYTGLWCVFLLGVPLQVLEVLWVFFRTLFRKQKGLLKDQESKLKKNNETE